MKMFFFYYGVGGKGASGSPDDKRLHQITQYRMTYKCVAGLRDGNLLKAKGREKEEGSKKVGVRGSRERGEKVR